MDLLLTNIALPIGIQTLSYTIDVYTDKTKVNHNFYICFVISTAYCRTNTQIYTAVRSARKFNRTDYLEEFDIVEFTQEHNIDDNTYLINNKSYCYMLEQLFN